MDDQTFQVKLAELMSKIQKLPEGDRGRLERLVAEAAKGRERIQASVSELQESLDHLRLTIKYLVFDLEATRRENAYLRRLVEQANRDENPQGGGTPTIWTVRPPAPIEHYPCRRGAAPEPPL